MANNTEIPATLRFRALPKGHRKKKLQAFDEMLGRWRLDRMPDRLACATFSSTSAKPFPPKISSPKPPNSTAASSGSTPSANAWPTQKELLERILAGELISECELNESGALAENTSPAKSKTPGESTPDLFGGR